MNRHLQKIVSDSRDIKNQTLQWFKELSRPKQFAIGVGILVLLIVVVRAFGDDVVKEDVVKAPREVTLSLVSDLANDESAIPLLGTVTSTSEATIRAESSGKLTRVYKKLGDYVAAGQVIAEFENSGERAAVLQAEGSYDQAKAARDISRINSNTTSSSLSDSKTNSLNTISSVYVIMDDSIRVKTDAGYTNPRNADVRFSVAIPDANLVFTLESSRRSIETILKSRESRNKTLTQGSDLLLELDSLQNELQTIKTYLDTLATAYSKALPDTAYSQSDIDSGKIQINIARTSIGGALSSVSGSRASLRASIAATEAAEKTVNQDSSSAAIATADAQVKQALGSYNAALSRLEKTVIRSPITGTLNSLSIQTGDFVSAFTEVGVVSNNGALEVVAYVTEDDAKRISVGNKVMVDTSVQGVVTRIASAIDPRTKKIEVRVGITDTAKSLVNGQSVRIAVGPKVRAQTTPTTGPLTIPLSALKLTPNGAYVFTVTASSSLIAIPVQEGAILGEEIQILTGLTGTESIVIDARGLKEGMVVTIKEK